MIYLDNLINYLPILEISLLDEIDMQIIFKEELKDYLEFDETRHVIKLAKTPSDGSLNEYISRGVLDVRKIFTRFLEHIYRSVANLSENKSKMDSFGLAAMTVDWEPCRGKLIF